ncbi:aromatic ring-opening dioxygenase [Xylogone sp. PMI_703]|nr:aromatic ring-opening dioxygenase [Xylogone sp. PMI_703]
MTTLGRQPNPSLPVLFASHGTPLTCCTPSDSTEWWQKFGKTALEHGIKGLVYVCSHWTELDDRVRVGTKVNPRKLQMDIVPREHWENYPINVSTSLGKRVVTLFKQAGFSDVEEDPDADWHDDNTTPSKWMFPEGTPPCTSISLNARYDAVFHVKIGQALRPLRKEGILIVGSGSILGPLPSRWCSEYIATGGPALAGAVVRLTENPYYRLAHPSNDHFHPLLVIAGVVSDEDDTGVYGCKMAETWDMGNVCSSQYLWGSWT